MGDREQGFIVIHRKVHSSWLYQSLSAEQRSVFMSLLLLANWREGAVWHAGAWHPVRRGELAHSLATIAEHAAVSVKVVRTALEKMFADDSAAGGNGPFLKTRWTGTAAGTGLRVLTICKYEEYQTVGHEAGTVSGIAPEQNGHAVGHDTGTPRAPDRAPDRARLGHELTCLNDGSFQAAGHEAGTPPGTREARLGHEAGTAPGTGGALIEPVLPRRPDLAEHPPPPTPYTTQRVSRSAVVVDACSAAAPAASLLPRLVPSAATAEEIWRAVLASLDEPTSADGRLPGEGPGLGGDRAASITRPVKLADLVWQAIQDKRAELGATSELWRPKGFEAFVLEFQRATPRGWSTPEAAASAHESYLRDRGIHAVGHPTAVFIRAAVWRSRMPQARDPPKPAAPPENLLLRYVRDMDPTWPEDRSWLERVVSGTEWAGCVSQDEREAAVTAARAKLAAFGAGAPKAHAVPGGPSG